MVTNGVSKAQGSYGGSGSVPLNNGVTDTETYGLIITGVTISEKLTDSQVAQSTDFSQIYNHTFTSTYNIVSGIQVYTCELDINAIQTNDGCTITTIVSETGTATHNWNTGGGTSQPKYSIQISDGAGTPTQSLVAQPSVVACGQLRAFQQPITLQVAFFDTTTQTVANGGSLNISLAEKFGSGAHPHAGRPLGQLDEQTGESPLSTTYTAGQAAGEIDLTVTGTVPDGSTPAAAQGAITIQNKNAPFQNLSGITFSVKSHPQGTTGTTRMQSAITNMVNSYVILAKLLGVANPRPIDSQGASLPLGGVFDITQLWTQPHCGHRDGETIDLSLSKDARERVALSLAAREAGFAFFVPTESPSDPTANHWHAKLTN
jgi:hypothetical protein